MDHNPTPCSKTMLTDHTNPLQTSFPQARNDTLLITDCYIAHQQTLGNLLIWLPSCLPHFRHLMLSGFMSWIQILARALFCTAHAALPPAFMLVITNLMIKVPKLPQRKEHNIPVILPHAELFNSGISGLFWLLVNCSIASRTHRS